MLTNNELLALKKLKEAKVKEIGELVLKEESALHKVKLDTLRKTVLVIEETIKLYESMLTRAFKQELAKSRGCYYENRNN